jgi:hypothetical protein
MVAPVAKRPVMALCRVVLMTYEPPGPEGSPNRLWYAPIWNYFRQIALGPNTEKQQRTRPEPSALLHPKMTPAKLCNRQSTTARLLLAAEIIFVVVVDNKSSK